MNLEMNLEIRLFGEILNNSDDFDKSGLIHKKKYKKWNYLKLKNYLVWISRDLRWFLPTA